ncbi:MAG: aminotransferase [Gammaproteobacteria bacterium]|nr:aminotransferase [Gammaproteobacteria bacterium]
MVVESYIPANGHAWSVPVFLFRYHADVGKYLFHLARDPSKKRQLWGRFGDDFIGIGFDSIGGIGRFIVGEAKYRKVATKLTIEDLLLGSREQVPPGSGQYVRKDDGILPGFRKAPPVPEGLGQLQAILMECAPDQYAEAILSLDKVLAIHPQQTIPRTDLVIIAGNNPAMRKSGETNVPSSVRPQEYDAGRELYVVEVFLHHGAELIESLYDSLWSGGADGTT